MAKTTMDYPLDTGMDTASGSMENKLIFFNISSISYIFAHMYQLLIMVHLYPEQIPSNGYWYGGQWIYGK